MTILTSQNKFQNKLITRFPQITDISFNTLWYAATSYENITGLVILFIIYNHRRVTKARSRFKIS